MKKLLVSFSGGLTSAYMGKRLSDEYGDRYELRFAFANTGEEREETLVFIDRCSQEWGIHITWLEAVVYAARRSSGHRVVDFSSASRKGEPFEAVIKKYGIPNKPFPHCTRELKRNTIKSWLREVGWADCQIAIGIRDDERKRRRSDANVVYPLMDMFPTTKPMINDWWEEQPFQLGLLSYQGNCKWCWKKSTKKLIQIAQETPEAFEFPARMEREYAMAGPSGQPQVFFRERRSTKDILALAQLVRPQPFIQSADEDAGCSESCEAF